MTIAGAKLEVRPGLLLMAAGFVVVFADRFDDGLHNRYLVAGAFVVALYASVIVHELAHLAVARGYGMPVKSITLHALGGATAIEGESRKPGQEFLTAIIGPVASAVIGGCALLVGAVADGTAGSVLTTLGSLNLFLAAFNLVPAWPMDGGRVLKALVWGLTGRESLGTGIAGWCGRLTAVALGALGIVLLGSNGTAAAWDFTMCLLVAWFLWIGSASAIRHGRLMSRVDQLKALDFALDEDPTDLPILAAELNGQPLLREIALHRAEAFHLVDERGRSRGVLYPQDIEQAYRERA
jgi:Zn-dependent protease